jgi:hypothetical protein
MVVKQSSHQMKKHKPLLILAIIQISTALGMVLTLIWPNIYTLKTLQNDLSIYCFVLASLYAALGILYLLGSVNDKHRDTALIIACINIPLEILSYWVGFPKVPIPYWSILIFSLAIGIPCYFCFRDVVRKMNK